MSAEQPKKTLKKRVSGAPELEFCLGAEEIDIEIWVRRYVATILGLNRSAKEAA